MADRASSSQQASPKNSVDTPEEVQRAANGTGPWTLQSLNQLHSQMERMDDRLNSRFDDADKRLRTIEGRINIVIGGTIVAVAVISILGWILSPFLKAIAEKMISGG